MSIYFKRLKEEFLFAAILRTIIFCLSFSLVFPPSYAQTQSLDSLNLPPLGLMITSSPAFEPPKIKGLIVNTNNALSLDFIVHPGDNNIKDEELKKESVKLIKYFMAALTVPEEEMWVNLSPYEKDRIIPVGFGDTEMGRDLLAQDYILKQLTASLLYPEKELGNNFWDRVYKKVYQTYGTIDIPMNTFNKVWIVPEKAVIYENGSSAFIVESRLKVMLEEDYLSLQTNAGSIKHGLGNAGKDDLAHISEVSSQVIKEIIIPEIEKEVNHGKTFANLRQISNSVILAMWYKKKVQRSILKEFYINKNKTNGIDTKDKNITQRIYQRYIEAFKKGVYELIKEEYDPSTKEVIPKKYFSGGVQEDWRGKVDHIQATGDLGNDLEGSFKVEMRLDAVEDNAQASSEVVSFDIAKEFIKVQGLGEGIPIHLLVKGKNSDELISRRQVRKRTLGYKPLRDMHSDSFIDLRPLSVSLEREKSFWFVEGKEIRGMDTKGDITAVAFSDKVTLLDTGTGQIIKEIKNPLFKHLHSVTFHPIKPDLILLASARNDRILEVNIRTEEIVYEWLAWEHGYNKNSKGFTLAESKEILSKDRTWEIFSREELLERLRSEEGIKDKDNVAVIINPRKIKHPLGLEDVLLSVHPNWASYNQDGTKFFVSFLIKGEVVEIDRATGDVNVIIDKLSSPHGFIEYKNGYLITDTENARVLLIDKEFHVKDIFDFKGFPKSQKIRETWGDSEWFQFSYPINEDLIATIDSYEAVIYVWSPDKKKYSIYPYNKNWQVQAVFPADPKKLSNLAKAPLKEKKSKGQDNAQLSNKKKRDIAYLNGLIVPESKDSRSVEIEIYRSGKIDNPEKKLFKEYFEKSYIGVSEYLKDTGTSEEQMKRIIFSDKQAVSFVIPTYDNTENKQNRFQLFSAYLSELRTVIERHADWKVEFIIVVNGLGQENYLKEILEFSNMNSTDKVPITVINLPMGGRLKNEKIYAKTIPFNSAVEYAKENGSTIIAFNDDDIAIEKNEILSNIEFLLSKSRELNKPVLTGSKPISIQGSSLWYRIFRPEPSQVIRGSSMFSFTKALPPIPNVPMNEDYFLRLYFSEIDRKQDTLIPNYYINPEVSFYFKYPEHFLSAFKQRYRWVICDYWTQIFMMKSEKYRISKHQYGRGSFLPYFKKVSESKKPLREFLRTFPLFIFKFVTKVLAATELWVRQKVGRPRYSSNWGSTVSYDTKDVPTLQRFSGPLSVSIAAEENTKELFSTNPNSPSDNMGGIDLNPNNFDLQIEGEYINIDFIKGQPIFNDMNFKGFSPIIINITPINNISVLLGKNINK